MERLPSGQTRARFELTPGALQSVRNRSCGFSLGNMRWKLTAHLIRSAGAWASHPRLLLFWLLALDPDRSPWTSISIGCGTAALPAKGCLCYTARHGQEFGGEHSQGRTGADELRPEPRS